MLDVGENLGDTARRQLLHLWLKLGEVQRDISLNDEFRWPWSASGHYTAKSTYKMLCHGQIISPLADSIWKCRAPLKNKIFMWLAAKHRIWTTERRARHGLQLQADACHLCTQGRQVWYACRAAIGWPLNIPTADDQLESWWLRERGRLAAKERKRFDSWVLLISWNIWKQRNARVFGNATQLCNEDELAAKTVADMKLWSEAGVGDLSIE